METLRLQDKVALITGAANGMGRACSLAFAREGADLVLLDVDREKLGQVTQEIKDIGREALGFVVDVTDQQMVNRAVAEALAWFKKIDILVNNAGYQGPGAAVWEVEPTAWRKTIEVNLWGVFLLCRAVIPQMVARCFGKVINVASGAGQSPMAFFSGYSAAKAAVIHFTRTIAEELKPYGITANAMGVRGITGMWRDVLEAGPGGGTTTASIRAQYEAGMSPKVEENMPVFVFLASDESNHVTGQYLEANSLPSYLIGKVWQEN